MGEVTLLTDAEWEIMKTVWYLSEKDRRFGVPVREVHESLYPAGEKALTTVQTVMEVLVKKGFLSREKIGMVNFFSPVVLREEMEKREMRALVERAFDGSVDTLVEHLVGSEVLTVKQLDRMRTLIEEAKKRRHQRARLTPDGS